jgi:PD-(D/E)XK endonuclease
MEPTPARGVAWGVLSMSARARRPLIARPCAVLVYCPDTDRVYALDIEEVASSHCVLRVDPTANGQAKRIRWAADHELPA